MNGVPGGDPTTTRFVSSPLVEFLAAAPDDLARRLVAEHRDDGSGHCRRCPIGAHAGHLTWPSAIYTVASRAVQLRRTDARHGLVVLTGERAVIRVSHTRTPDGREIVTTEWVDEIRSEPGTLAEAQVLAARHGLRPQVPDADGTTHWRAI